MSEVYNFKPLSEVEPLQEPTSATSILAVDGGKVKQIPASAVGGGGGGAGNFIVNVAVAADDFSVSGDKTFVEMEAAIESGALPVAAVDFSAVGVGFVYSLVSMYVPGEGIIFLPNTGEGYVPVICSVDDIWQIMLAE